MRTSDREASDDRQPLTLSIPQAAQLLGISVSKAYEAARSGELPTLRVGSRVLISRRRLEELIDGPAGGHGPPDRDTVADETGGADFQNYWRRSKR
jgi:excisionase family DNA binding protein